MTVLLRKYLQKLLDRDLVNPDRVIFIGRDDRFYLEGTSPEVVQRVLISLFNHLKVNTLLWAEPKGAWLSCLEQNLKRTTSSVIIPEDCETRTFFHHFPVVPALEPEPLAEALSETKAVIVKEPLGIVSKATVSPEQAFVGYSSACFSLFVKAFYDILEDCRRKGPLKEQTLKEFQALWQNVPEVRIPEEVIAWPEDLSAARDALIKVGKAMVQGFLVDSYFGNLSILIGDIMLISQTAASLDELEDGLEEVPLGGGSTVALVASSEMPTHRRVYERTNHRVILHGHPRFSVIMSMFCESPCELKGQCHIRCPQERYLCGARVVPGEIGTGRFAIVNTVPEVLASSDAAVVTSHGVFTAHRDDITAALRKMVEIEQCAKLRYYKTVTGRELEDSKDWPCPD
jgi:ribulose-5-phosphate 4-epimerase/fuculose-1-phosphate aldolase